MRTQTIDFDANPFDGNEEIDLMVVAGGDGTVNFALNALKKRGLNIPIGVIPAGTANDFAGALGISKNHFIAADQIANGTISEVDCGCVNGLYFVNILSFGLFTTTSQHTKDEYKHKLGKLAYIVEGMKELRHYHSVPLKITTDGETLRLNALISLIFNGESAGGFRLARTSSIEDGLLDCIVLENRSFLRSVFSMLMHLMGFKTKTVHHIKAQKIDITSKINEPTDVDGQQGREFPLHIECLKGGFRVMRPAKL